MVRYASIIVIPQVGITRRIDGAGGVKSGDNKKFVAKSVGVFGSWKESGKAYELPVGSL